MPRILVASGTDALRNLVQLTFAGERWDVHEAQDDRSCVRALTGGVPDVLIVDADLPDAGGLRVASLLRSQQETSHVRMLLLYDLARPPEADELADVDVDAVVRRPFGTFTLLDAVEGLLAAG